MLNPTGTAMPAEAARKLFTVDDYYRMAEAGILKEDDRVELIEGEIVEMSPIGDRHARSVRNCLNALADRRQELFLVDVQNPLRIDSYTEPVPDLMLLKPRPDKYRSGHPRPSDVLLVLEVMDTSTVFDRTRKLPIYAHAGIPEVWLIDLNRGQIEVHSQPNEGVYVNRSDFGPGDRIRSATLDLEVEAGDLLA